MSVESSKELDSVQNDLIARMAELRSKDAEILRARNSELRRLEEQCWEKDAEILRLKTLESDLQKRLEGLREANELRIERRESYLQEIGELKSQLEGTENRIQQIHEDYSRKLARAVDKAWEKDLELEAIKSEQVRIQKEISVLTQVKLETEKNLEIAKSEIATLKAELKSATSEIRSIEKQSKDDSLVASNTLLKVSKERENYVRGLETEIAALRVKVQVLNSERDSVKTGIEARVESVRELESQIAGLRATLSNIHNEHASEVQSLLNENRIFIRRMKEKHESETERLKAGFESEKSALEAEFSKESSATRSMLADKYESRISELVRGHDAKVEALRAIEAELNSEIKKLQLASAGQLEKIKALTEANRILSDEFEKLQSLTEKQSAEIKSLESAVTRLETEANSTIVRLEETRQENSSLRESKDRVESRLDEAINKNSDLISQLASLHEQVSSKELAVHGLQTELNEMRSDFERCQSEINVLNLELERARVSHKENLREANLIHMNQIKEEKLKRQAESIEWASRLNEETRVLGESVSRIQTEKVAIERRLAEVTSESQATISNLKSELEEQRKVARETNENLLKTSNLAEARQGRIDALNTEITKLRAKNDEAVEELNRVKTEAEEKLETVRAEMEARLEVERASHSMELSDLEKRLEEISMENANLKLALNAKASSLDSAQREFEIRCEHREKQIQQREKAQSIREMQLKQYANSITDQKAEFIRQTKLLAEEINSASKIHPLKDYLKMTEFELSRAEVQLKLTPTISSDRAKLESYFEKMVEQRNFLEKIVEESERKFASQAQQLLDLIRSPKMASTPPPPPIFQGKTDSTSDKRIAVDFEESPAFDPVIEN